MTIIYVQYAVTDKQIIPSEFVYITYRALLNLQYQ